MIDDSTIPPLAQWTREFAESVKAPPGQPNAAFERLTEAAMFLEQYVDFQQATMRQAALRAGVDGHNTEQRSLCDLRRADPVPCTGNGKTVKCADCPKRLGLSLTARVLA